MTKAPRGLAQDIPKRDARAPWSITPQAFRCALRRLVKEGTHPGLVRLPEMSAISVRGRAPGPVRRTSTAPIKPLSSSMPHTHS